MLPGSWGLRGKTRQLAEADYEYGDDPYKLCLRRNRILYGDDPKTLEIENTKTNLDYDQIDQEAGLRRLAELEHEYPERRLLDIDLEFGKIEKIDYEKELARLEIKDEDELKIAHLDIDKRYGKINDIEHEKAVATIKKEPWVIVKNFDTDRKNPAQGSIELDWNTYFVEFLEGNGYGPNPEPEETVDQWLNDLCRNIALDAFDGIGENTEKLNKNRTVHQDVILKNDIEAGDKK